ncbi:MAG: hypothetical protein WCF84_02290 [Anaerolineae bacterium]
MLRTFQRRRWLQQIMPQAALTGPITLILDQFTGTNGTNLTAHIIAPINTPATSWVAKSGSITIQSNAAQSTGTPDLYSADAGHADITLTMDWTSAGGISGVAVRILDTNNYWRITRGVGGQNLLIVEVNAGTPTTRASASSITGNGQIYVNTSGATITAKFAGANQISYGSATLNQSNTNHGIYAASSASYDNCQVTTP